ncbi:MAG: S-layer homology domain-containing protein, partial [Oscillospiraceae bacterium]|nr:S-layer homology domain-containing protein [Oscillospiraceae bacterium]
NLPAGLSAAAPTAYGKIDGKIIGTTAGMEYADNSDFTGAKPCAANETAGLPAGDYYVRIAQSTNYKAGPAVMVTVPQGPLAVTSIAIATPAAKTEYQVGDTLDVTGLTLTVTMSDGKTYTVPVAAGMVSGFDSSAAAASQTLTVTYGGMEVAYDIAIAEVSSGGDSGNTGGGDSTGGDSTGDGSSDGDSTGGGSTGGGSTGGDSTGGGSTGGGPTGGGTSGGCSVGGGSPSGSDTETNTVKNPDGSTTSTKTDKSTGIITETTTHPDGSTLTVVTHPDGPVETTIKQADGLTASLHVDQGSARGEVRLPAQKEDTGAAVALPIPALPGNDAQLSIHTGASLPVRVEIPIEGGAVTTVACFVDRDGTEHIVKTAFVEDGKITLNVPDEAVVRFRDNSKSFEDTEKHWAGDDIRFVTSRELFLGTTADTFAPNESMTRAMLTVVLARLDGVEVSGRSAYKEGIAWAVDKGISDGRDPGSQVTREQFITMLYRYAGSPAVADAQLPFSDAASVSGYARDAVCWAAENGILNGFGDGSFRPKGNATRAQAASLLTRYVQYLNQQ